MDNNNIDSLLIDFLQSVPEVTDEEQREIYKIHGEPEGYEPVYSRQVDP